jgi:putative intracellular protease/amidase
VRRIGHLFERVVEFEALRAAAGRAARGKRHRPEVAAFLVEQERELLRLEAELCAGVWAPRPYRMFLVRDPKAA